MVTHSAGFLKKIVHQSVAEGRCRGPLQRAVAEGIGTDFNAIWSTSSLRAPANQSRVRQVCSDVEGG
jgi:hypothetical protein